MTETRGDRFRLLGVGVVLVLVGWVLGWCR